MSKKKPAWPKGFSVEQVGSAKVDIGSRMTCTVAHLEFTLMESYPNDLKAAKRLQRFLSQWIKAHEARDE